MCVKCTCRPEHLPAPRTCALALARAIAHVRTCTRRRRISVKCTRNVRAPARLKAVKRTALKMRRPAPKMRRPASKTCQPASPGGLYLSIGRAASISPSSQRKTRAGNAKCACEVRTCTHGRLAGCGRPPRPLPPYPPPPPSPPPSPSPSSSP
jgi:hypothetical protein